jgi:hypothetical protein
MPPLLAALFLIHFQCPIVIVQAIDLSMEWRLPWAPGQSTANDVAHSWYNGFTACFDDGFKIHKVIGTMSWPKETSLCRCTNAPHHYRAPDSKLS